MNVLKVGNIFLFRASNSSDYMAWTQHLSTASTLKIKDVYRLTLSLSDPDSSKKIVAARHRCSGRRFVIQIVDRRQYQVPFLRNEMSLLQKMTKSSHANVVLLEDLFVTRKYLYTIHERVEVDVHSNEWKTARTKTMICGYLRIRNRFKDHSYKRCFCVLRNEAIYCCPSSNEWNDDYIDHKSMNCYSLDIFDVIQWSHWDNVKFELSTKGSGMEWAAPIEHDGYCLIFEAPSPEECKQWRMHLSKDTSVKKTSSRDPDDRYKGAFRGHGNERRERRHGVICTGRTFPRVSREMLQNRYHLSY